MTSRGWKLVALLVVVSVVALVLQRQVATMDDADVPLAPGGGLLCGETPIVAWDAEGPAGYRPYVAYGFDEPPGMAFEHLGRARYRARLGAHDRVRRQVNWRCIFDEAVRHGANAWIVEGIDDDVPGLPAGEGEIIEELVFVHAGQLPPERRAHFGDEACMVMRVQPDSPASEGGLRPGDLLLDLDHRGLDAGRAQPCALTRMLDEVQVGRNVVLTVLRNGAPMDLTLTAPGPYGYSYVNVPVLDGGVPTGAR